MKKYILLIGFLTLTTACNIGVTPTPALEPTQTAALPPTPIPAVATPAFTPASTNTPVPELYFTDEFDTASTFWGFQQAGGIDSPQAAFEGGALKFNFPAADTWYLGVHTAHTYTNIVVRAKVSASASGSVGLICRYDESKGWFEFNIDNGGTYSLLLGQWLAPGIAKYIPITTDVSKQLLPGNVNAELGLFCEDNLISLYVNDVLLRRLDITNYGLTTGNIGVAAAAYREAPMSALFEWVKVSSE